MDHLFKDQLVVLSYLMARYFSIASTVLTMFLLPHCLVPSSLVDLALVAAWTQLSALQNLSGYSPDHFTVTEFCARFAISIQQVSLLHFAGYLAMLGCPAMRLPVWQPKWLQH
jgi:hypothetical protein